MQISNNSIDTRISQNTRTTKVKENVIYPVIKLGAVIALTGTVLAFSFGTVVTAKYFLDKGPNYSPTPRTPYQHLIYQKQ